MDNLRSSLDIDLPDFICMPKSEVYQTDGAKMVCGETSRAISSDSGAAARRVIETAKATNQTAGSM
jgi:hypothetical protein